MATKYPIMIAGDNFGCGSSREVTFTWKCVFAFMAPFNHGRCIRSSM